MLFGKLFTLVCATVLSYLAISVEAKHKNRNRGWRKLVHHKCKGDDTAVLAVGGELNKALIRTVHRALKRHIHVTIAISGRDLKAPYPKKHKKRNILFVKKVAPKVTFVALPWSPKHPVHRMKKQKALKMYKKSTKAIEKVIGTRPNFIHVEPKALIKRVVKYFNHKGFHIMGNTVKEATEKVLNKNSFIALQKANIKSFAKLISRTKKSAFDIVNLKTCTGKSPYHGGLLERPE